MRAAAIVFAPLVLLGCVTPAPRPTVAPSTYPDASYENIYVNGLAMQRGRVGPYGVVAGLSSEGGLHAIIAVKNDSEVPVAINPEQVVLRVIDAYGRPVNFLGIIRPADKLQAYKTELEWETALTFASAALANAPQPQTSHVSGSFWGSSGSGSFSGSVTTPPSAADKAAVNAQLQTQLEAATTADQAAIQSLEGRLLWAHTLSPGTAIIGELYFETSPALHYELFVPFGDQAFVFRFHAAGTR